MRRILLIGLGVVIFTVVLSVITAQLLAESQELPQEVSLVTAVSSSNHLVRAGGGGLGLLYYDRDLTYNVIYLNSADDGATFSEPDTLNPLPYLNMLEPPDVQAGPGGDVYAVWDAADDSRGDSTDVFLARLDGGTGQWDLPVKIVTAEHLAAGPRLAVDQDGTLHLVFYDENGESDIKYVRSTDGGTTWSDPVVIDGIDEWAQTPCLAVDHDGHLHVAFIEITDIGPPNDYKGDEVHWVTSADGGLSWQAPVAIAGHGGAQSTFGLALPALAVDADNTVHLVWGDDDGIDRDIYHAYLPDGGAWSAPANVSHSSVLSYFPSLAADAAGHVHLLYQEGDPGSAETFYAYYDGGWSTPQNLSQTASDSRGPSITSEPDKPGFIAAWLEATTSFRIEVLLSPEVWPGDTDNNGAVDALDVVPLALHWSETGPAREGEAQQSWTAKPVIPWMIRDAVYADANGDGLVDARDILPVGLNWSLSHEIRGPALAPDLEEMDHRPYLAAYREIRESLMRSGDSEPARAMIQLLDGLISQGEDQGGPRGPIPPAGVASPNPAGSGEAHISFTLDQPGDVEIAVYDPRGRLVRSLLRERREAGRQDVAWDGFDGEGRAVPAGLYLCRINGPGGASTAKILWIR